MPVWLFTPVRPYHSNKRKLLQFYRQKVFISLFCYLNAFSNYWICALISFLNFIGLAIKLNLFVAPPVVTIIEPKPKMRPIILWLMRSPSHLLKINSRASRLKIPDFRITFLFVTTYSAPIFRRTLFINWNSPNNNKSKPI